MAWHLNIWDWLIHTALGVFLVLAVGGLAVRWCRQPVRRLRLITLTLAGCVLVPCLNQVSVIPRWPAGWLMHRVAVEGARADERLGTPTRVEMASLAGPDASVPVSSDRAARAVGRRVPRDSHTAVLPGTVTSPGDGSRARSRDVATWLAALPGRPIIVLAYASVVAALVAWWLVGEALLLRLYLSASPASPNLVRVFREVAGPAGDRVRLLQSDRVKLPFTFTWWRPFILVPADLERAGDVATVRYCLAHEWSHIERGDAWVWNLASLVELVGFYQPLFWWVRHQLRLCQDYLADARAAEQAPAAEDYADYLLTLARHRLDGLALPALGIGDRRSNLYRRIVMLIQDREPLEQRCRWTWNAAASAAAVVLIVIASGLRLDAGMPSEKAGVSQEPAGAQPAAAPAKPAVPSPSNSGETLTYRGKVTDQDTGKAIAGAVVVVRRSVLPDPKTGENRIIEESRHQTDADGKYTFTIPPEQVAERRLYIELDVEHDDYAPRKHFGYALGMIRKNEKLGGRPFFENVALRPGKAITGRIESPDGKPVAGVKVLGYSKTDKLPKETFEYGSFADMRTDAEGRFRIVLTTPGPAVFWILPEKFAPSLHVLKDNKRGDLGTYILEPGIALQGKVLDAQGKPLQGVYVNFRRERGQTPADELLGQLSVSDAINRTALSGANGEFQVNPLPPGDYRVQPGEHPEDSSLDNNARKLRPLPAVFAPRKLTLKEGETPEPLVIRASPHVVIEAQYYDSKGKPRSGHDCFIWGEIDGTWWHSQGKPDASGKIVIQAPHGLENATLDLMTNEHGALRHRLVKGGSLENSRNVKLGTLDHDVKGIEIIRYEAPIVISKVVGEDGQKPKGARVTAVYPPGKAQHQGKMILKGGAHSDVSFEEQEDGRFRSEQLFPDEEVTFTAEAEGYEPKSEMIKLPEGATKDVTFSLKKKAK
jgi:beta-lactamase regulating signal transducer with metallopeptidase domain/protocatechuate 3,4-dioxygenase beta subunit